MNLERTLILAPHPDDDVIAAGGLIQRVLSTGGKLQILFVTDGENNPWPQRWMEKKWRITAGDRAVWGALRRDEAHCSLTHLGVPPESTAFLGFPDQELSTLIRRGDTRLVRTIRKAVADFAPTQIVTPSSRDLHRDHRAVAWCAHIAAAGETPINTYMVHGHSDHRRIAQRIELSEAEQRRKRAAIECHQSQLLLSRERFLSHAGPVESFYIAEYDLISVESTIRTKFAALRHALHVTFGVYPPVDESGVQPTADVHDGARDVPGLL